MEITQYESDIIKGICGNISEEELLEKYPLKSIEDIRADAIIINVMTRCNQEYKGDIKAFRVAENVPDVAY